MLTFEYNGVTYRSQRAFCITHHVSYNIFKRLRRTYKRAKKDILVAVRWILGIEQKSKKEALTYEGERERELARFRKIKYKAKKREEIRLKVLKIINMEG